MDGGISEFGAQNGESRLRSGFSVMTAPEIPVALQNSCFGTVINSNYFLLVSILRTNPVRPRQFVLRTPFIQVLILEKSGRLTSDN